MVVLIRYLLISFFIILIEIFCHQGKFLPTFFKDRMNFSMKNSRDSRTQWAVLRRSVWYTKDSQRRQNSLWTNIYPHHSTVHSVSFLNYFSFPSRTGLHNLNCALCQNFGTMGCTSHFLFLTKKTWLVDRYLHKLC